MLQSHSAPNGSGLMRPSPARPRRSATEPSTPAGEPGPRRASARLERRKAQTRAAILEAASAFFDEQGYESTSVLHIAERADTGVGTVYGYFRSKEALLDEVLRQRVAAAVGAYMGGLAGSAGYLERIMDALALFAEFIAANRSILLATFQLSTRRGLEPDEVPAHWLYVALREMLQAGIEAGEIREVPADATARTIIGVHLMGLLGIAVFRERAGDDALPAELREMVRVLLER